MAARYFVETLPTPGEGRRSEITAELAHHLRTVLRLRVGEDVWLFDGKGGEARVQVAELVSKRRLAIEILEHRQVSPSEGGDVTASFSPPNDKQRLQQILEHGTELGVTRFQPLVFERSKEGVRSGVRRERWERITQAAAGQCGRSFLPRIEDPTSLDAWIAASPQCEGGSSWVAEHPSRWPGDSGDQRVVVPGRDLRLVVGPEGGMTEGERRSLADAGFLGIALGAHTLRLETAVLAGVTLLQRWRADAAKRSRASQAAEADGHA